MSDPASLNAHVVITGMDLDEATTAFCNLPVGSKGEFRVTQPALGGKRLAVIASDLTIQGARDLTAAVFMHCDRVQSGGTDG